MLPERSILGISLLSSAQMMKAAPSSTTKARAVNQEKSSIQPTTTPPVTTTPTTVDTTATTPSRRRRPREQIGWTPTPPPKAYKLKFLYEPLGRYFRSSKRRLYWSFGFTNLTRLQSGHTGNDCRGEEHEVEVLWSLRSGKTRVYWNRRNISSQIRKDPKSEKVILSWKTPSGELLQVVANSEPAPGVVQYDLLIDGVSFSFMPDVLDLGRTDTPAWPDEYDRDKEISFESSQELSFDESKARIKRMTMGETERVESSCLESNGSDRDSLHSLHDHFPFDGRGIRLAMAGFGSESVEADELHSELYSPMLESLRHRIVTCLPQTEEMISRSIIQTFFPDYVSQHSEDILSTASRSSEERDPQQIEVDALFGAYEWVVLHSDSDPLLSLTYMHRPNRASGNRNRSWSAPGSSSSPLFDSHETELDHMQKLIDSIFIKVRNEDLSSDEGARILLGVAAILQLEFASHLPGDTVIFDDLDPSISTDDLRSALCAYGDLEAVAISSQSPKFGFCRFFSEGSFKRFLETPDKNLFPGSGVSQPRIIPLTEKVQVALVDQAVANKTKSEEGRTVSSAPSTPPQSSNFCAPSTIPHLMGLWADGDEESVEVVVSTDQLSCETNLQKRSSNSSPRSAMMGFENLPNRTKY